MLKKTLTIHLDRLDIATKYLSIEEKGKLLDIMCKYQMAGELPVKTNDRAFDIAIDIVINGMELCNNKYDEMVQKRSIAGQKGMQKRWSKDGEKVNKTPEPKLEPEATKPIDKKQLNAEKMLYAEVIKLNPKFKKKNKLEPEIIEILLLQTPELIEPLLNWIEMRKKIKRPVTARALELACKNLDKLANNNLQLKISIIHQSVLNCWQGFFPLKSNEDVTEDLDQFLKNLSEVNNGL